MPVIALLGRPNVGKSTLFNRLTKTRDALVADFSGLTRDRQYGHARINSRDCIVIDTGGLVDEASDIDDLIDFSGDFCMVCNEKDNGQNPENWIGCDRCGRWFHKACTSVVAELKELTHEELEDYPFKCHFC